MGCLSLNQQVTALRLKQFAKRAGIPTDRTDTGGRCGQPVYGIDGRLATCGKISTQAGKFSRGGRLKALPGSNLKFNPFLIRNDLI
jgi:hypothetical protein